MTHALCTNIKPENVMLRRDGYVKVLDFGLAKLIEQRPVQVAATVGVAAGANPNTGVMGTVGYMSPEQARGIIVDARTDVWGLGVVIYEMLTGRPPFEGQTDSDVLGSILEREPASLSSV